MRKVLMIAGVMGLALASAPGICEMKSAFEILTTAPVTQPDFPAGVERLEYRSGVDGLKDWALVLPPASETAVWVVMIHGHGSHGDQLFVRPDLRDDWLVEFRRRGLGIFTPNLRDNAWMAPAAAADLHALLAEIRTRYRARQFILASGSMGGTSNLIYAGLDPEDVAGVVALCPATDLAVYHAWCREHNTGVIKEIADAMETAYGGPPAQQTGRYAAHAAAKLTAKLTMPIYVAHGSADSVIPVSQARTLAAAMSGKANFTYIEMPDGGHDTPLSAARDGLAWVLDNIRN